MLTANIFALMGLRQLYFLIGGLLERLVYLSYGLAFLLGFIGVKLVLHAMHENELPFINGGEPIAWAPDIPIWLSLGVIVGTLAVTTVWSLAASRKMTREELDARTGPRLALGGRLLTLAGPAEWVAWAGVLVTTTRGARDWPLDTMARPGKGRTLAQQTVDHDPREVEADLLIVGAGPAGLFGAYYAGFRG